MKKRNKREDVMGRIKEGRVTRGRRKRRRTGRNRKEGKCKR